MLGLIDGEEDGTGVVAEGGGDSVGKGESEGYGDPVGAGENDGYGDSVGGRFSITGLLFLIL